MQNKNSLVEFISYYAETQPDKFCLADKKNHMNYVEYFRYIIGFSRYLEKSGVKRGDRVVVKTIQMIPYLVSQMAIQLSGAVFVPLEKVIAAEKIQEIVSITEAKLIIAEKEGDYGCPFVPFTAVYENGWDGDIPYGSFRFPRGEDTAEILFSTGTTGKSKGIELSNASVVAVAENVKYGVEMKPDNVEIIPVPLNHSHGLRRYYANMLNGSCVVVMDGVVFVNQIFEAMDKYHVTSMDLVPAMLAILLKLSKDRLGDYADKLDYIEIGSAKIPDKDKEALCQLLPHTRLYDFYGSTEAGCSCILDFNKYKGKKDCIGKPTCNSIIKFVDDEGSEIRTSPQKSGLIITGGTMLMKGYYKDETLTADTLRGGYVYSSDEGYLGDDGLVYMLGRRGDIINIGGMKVDPAEIEEKVNQHPQIEDCVCVPMQDDIAGQAPKLFVVMKEGEEFLPISIRNYLNDKLESYKLPKIIEQMGKIPRTYNGKIIRKKLI